MSPREASLIVATVAELKRRGAWVLNFHGNAVRLGVPDIIGCLYVGRFLAIEGKQHGKRATPRQRAEIKRIRRAGGVAFEADSIDRVRAVLDALAADPNGDSWKEPADA